MLKEHGDRWYSELPALPGVTWGNLFVRGFIDTAWVVAGKDVRKLVPLLLDATPLQRLTVITSEPRAVRAFLQVEGIERLKQVRFDGLPHSQTGQQLRIEAKMRFPRTEFL